MERSFKIVSFNCEGIKRSKEFICDLLNSTKCHILCLQEIWLIDSNIDILNNIHTDYMYSGIAGVDSSK